MVNYYVDKRRIICSKKRNGEYIINNTLSGEEFSVDELGYQIIKKIIRQPNFEKVINDFLKQVDGLNRHEMRDYLDSLIERGIVYKKTSGSKKIFHIQWHLSDKCNLRCKHCYQVDYQGKKSLNYTSLVSILDKYFDLINKLDFNTEITLTGGEPFLEKKLYDLIEEIYQRDSNARIYILTNGTLIDQDIIQRLLPYNLYGVQISFDGYEKAMHDAIRGVGSFDKARRGVKLLQDFGIWTSIHTVIMKNNIAQVENYFELARNLNVRWITLSRYVPCGQGIHRIENVIQPYELKKIWERLMENCQYYPEITLNTARSLWGCLDQNLGTTCPAGDVTLTILHDGTVLPCRRFPVKIGNLMEQNFFEILNRSKILKHIQQKLPSACRTCEVVKSCKGGCPGLSFAYHGSIMQHCDPQCWRVNEKLPKVKEIGFDYDENNGYFNLPKNMMEVENLL